VCDMSAIHACKDSHVCASLPPSLPPSLPSSLPLPSLNASSLAGVCRGLRAGGRADGHSSTRDSGAWRKDSGTPLVVGLFCSLIGLFPVSFLTPLSLPQGRSAVTRNVPPGAVYGVEILNAVYGVEIALSMG
jgi:hypothetical protein